MSSDVATQIECCFDNVLAALTIVDRKLTWKDVLSVRSYHVGDGQGAPRLMVSLFI